MQEFKIVVNGSVFEINRMSGCRVKDKAVIVNRVKDSDLSIEFTSSSSAESFYSMLTEAYAIYNNETRDWGQPSKHRRYAIKSKEVHGVVTVDNDFAMTSKEGEQLVRSRFEGVESCIDVTWLEWCY